MIKDNNYDHYISINTSASTTTDSIEIRAENTGRALSPTVTLVKQRPENNRIHSDTTGMSSNMSVLQKTVSNRSQP